MGRSSITRRRFVGEAATAGIGLTIVPRHVLGGPGRRAPSDTLNVAFIGVGGRGADDVAGVSETGENVYALCDVDDERAAATFRSFPKAKRYRDFRDMLAREGDAIDAVVVATPDHTHTAAALMALRAGKHVYCEKPLARTIAEVRALEAAAREAGVATQMGNQGHAQEGTRRIREWMEAGAIGTVREVHLWTNRPIWPQAMKRPLEEYHVPPGLDWDLWLGPAPERPYHPTYAPFAWRGWWDFGTGALGDIACHAMDASFWALELGWPSRIIPESTRLFDETAPACSRITYEFPARGGRPPVRVIWRDGGLQPPRPAGFPGAEPWPPWVDGGQLWLGDDGALVADMYGQDPRLVEPRRNAELLADPPPEKYPRTGGVYAEWVAAARAGGRSGSDFAAHAGPLTQMVLLGNLALRAARAIEVDARSGEVSDAGIPAEWIRPTYREGWTM